MPEIKKIYELNFDKKGFDALVCLNSDLPPIEFFGEIKGLPILAADGAAVLMHAIGIEPDYIIGDMDSLYESPFAHEFPKEKLIFYPDQDTNDFEKILAYCEKKNYMNLLIVGFHGGALEHTLNNWSVLMRYARKLNLCVWDKGRYGIPTGRSFILKVKEKEIISIIPKATVKVTTKNFVWELQNEYISLGEREGARNRAAKSPVEIKIHEGEIILFIDSRLPYSPYFKVIPQEISNS